ncbi:hypothetical protein Vadar_012773 [Vaccinium darrowii]|uniref:Uncharacterized protein n=1 Tax=Vaccinium darrowii TaxID=229202 RepID=A0ACB7X0S2_9ERIC|nr:hypothetical protein Vadar_012773 [Vaccinium darrowii]
MPFPLGIGYEAKFTEEIVNEVKRKLRGKHLTVVDHQGSNQILIPPTKDFVEFTEARNTENVWECLMNDEVSKIGVYGMGGIGKTTIMKHIHNQLISLGKFIVYWVTVSKPFSITNIQSDIAKAVKLSFSDDKDELRRATELYATLSQNKQYVIILDDLWETFALDIVGIPEPTPDNMCKIVITTRSLDVCRMMDCATVEVKLLMEQEALTLFLKKAVKDDMLLAPEVKVTAAKVAKECAGLPLAIVTVAGSMRGLNGIHYWRNALDELINSTKDAVNVESEVFEQLKFSYSQLGDKVLQDCFLYCSLYPEDHAIPVKELLELWIVEELIVGKNSIQAMFDKGHDIIRILTSRCLLESFTDELGGECLRMHDLIRDMALRITRSSPRFMVKAGERQESVPDEDWSEDLEKISFMYSQIRELPIRPPVCPQLTTLLLNETGLEEISDSFFTNMPRLQVLDLSDNKIKLLPESISNLEKLRALILVDCLQLRYVPSLKKLKALKVFILTSSSIEEVPEGIEELVNLTKLDLENNQKLGLFPGWKLRRLLKLQFLRIDGTEVHTRVEDLMFLRELKVVAVQFDNVNGLNKYVKSHQFQGLERYRLLTGEGIDGSPLGEKEVCVRSSSEPFRSDQLFLPVDIDFFQLEAVDDLTCLSAIPSLKDARYLRGCVVRRCHGLESIFSSSFLEDGQISLQTVESFYMFELSKFRVLFDGIAPPHSIYFNLKELSFWKCEIMKNIFPVQFLQNFPNLEKLAICYCNNVEDIIVEIEEMSDRGNSISLQKLKSLELSGLPSLKSIYNGVIVCQSIEEVLVFDCPALRRLPLSVYMGSEQATSLPSLKYIRGKGEWWKSLEWDDPNIKTSLEPFFRDTG